MRRPDRLPVLLLKRETHKTLDIGIGDALSTDYFGLRDQLTPEQLDYLLRTRTFVDDVVLPVINEYWERAEVPRPLVEKLAVLGATEPHARRASEAAQHDQGALGPRRGP